MLLLCPKAPTLAPPSHLSFPFTAGAGGLLLSPSEVPVVLWACPPARRHRAHPVPPKSPPRPPRPSRNRTRLQQPAHPSQPSLCATPLTPSPQLCLCLGPRPESQHSAVHPRAQPTSWGPLRQAGGLSGQRPHPVPLCPSAGTRAETECGQTPSARRAFEVMGPGAGCSDQQAAPAHTPAALRPRRADLPRAAGHGPPAMRRWAGRLCPALPGGCSGVGTAPRSP